MANPVLTDDQWKKARACYEAGGALRDAQAASGIGRSTIAKRAREEGWVRGEIALTPEQQKGRMQTAAGVEAQRQMLAARRLQLAADLLEDAEELRAQLFSPVAVKEAKVVPQGQHAGSEVQLVTIDLDRPTPRDQQATATALAILVDKSQLLAGEATSRTEDAQRTPEERKARIAQLRDDLDERRKQREAATPAPAEPPTGTLG